ncbi:MAG: glycoside hydrolase family 1 protein [Myxococcales bacterium]
MLTIIGAVLVVLVAAVWIFAFAWGFGRSERVASQFSEPAPWTMREGFLWGAATADHQIEWSQDDSWTLLEKEALAHRRFEQLSPGNAKPGHIARLGDWPAEVVRKKANFDERMEADLDLAVSMKMNAFRFSFSWARLFPREDLTEPDPAGVAFYRRLLDAMKARKLTPSATLFHFAIPAWLAREKDGKKGWERADAVAHFERFAKAAAKEFGGDVTHWCTLNEPMVYLYLGYLQGVHPPNEQRKDPAEIAPVALQLLRAHAAAYKAIKDDATRRGTKTMVGMTHHVRAFEPLRNAVPLDRITARIVSQAFVWDFPDAVASGTLKLTTGGLSETVEGLAGTQDYLGLNYYGRYYVKSDLFHPAAFQVLPHDPDAKGEEINDLGWAIYPKGFSEALVEGWRRYRLPIYVLENGTADAQDEDVARRRLLVSHAREMWHAVKHGGADVRGYFHWALTDNFEWAEGFEGRFGLVKVDYRDGFKRIPRPSAEVFGRIAGANGVDGAVAEKWGE